MYMCVTCVFVLSSPPPQGASTGLQGQEVPPERALHRLQQAQEVDRRQSLHRQRQQGRRGKSPPPPLPPAVLALDVRLGGNEPINAVAWQLQLTSRVKCAACVRAVVPLAARARCIFSDAGCSFQRTCIVF